MEDLEDVRKRIRDKKYKKDAVLNERMFSRFYRFVMTTMSVFALVLMVSCFIKANPDIDVLTLIDEHVLSLLPLPFSEEKEVGSQLVNYTCIEGNYYVGNDENIYAFMDGLVQSVNQHDFSVLYNNGVEVIYKDLANLNIKTYDRVEKGEILGTYEQKFYMKLVKNDVEVRYEEIFA